MPISQTFSAASSRCSAPRLHVSGGGRSGRPNSSSALGRPFTEPQPPLGVPSRKPLVPPSPKPETIPWRPGLCSSAPQGPWGVGGGVGRPEPPPRGRRPRARAARAPTRASGDSAGPGGALGMLSGRAPAGESEACAPPPPPPNRPGSARDSLQRRRARGGEGAEPRAGPRYPATAAPAPSQGRGRPCWRRRGAQEPERRPHPRRPPRPGRVP